MPRPIATWNPARSVWETAQGTLCGHSGVFSEIWPTSGMTLGGSAFQLPPWTPRMTGSASSLLPTPAAADGMPAGRHSVGTGHKRTLPGEARLLPTPMARDHKAAGPADLERKSPNLSALPALLPTPTATPYGNNQSPSLGAAVRPSLDKLATLFPTPTASDGKAGNATRSGDRSGELLLKGIVQGLLPTPRASDGEKGGPNQRGSSGDLMLPSAVASIGDGTETLSSGGSES